MELHKTIPKESIAVATRTLLAAGFNITGSETHPVHTEIYCERTSTLGALIRYTIAFTRQAEFTQGQVSDIDRIARADGRASVFVGPYTGKLQIGWEVFLSTLGGAIPSWQALGPSYGNQLNICSLNQLPIELNGEPWQLFEDLVADGLEFCLGRRVRRFGGKKRGMAVSDMVAQLPDLCLEVVDAKAAKDGFDAQWQNLRPLVEYTNHQKGRQAGQNEVFGSIVVSSSFQQGLETLQDLSKRFYSETSVNLGFLTATTLLEMVTALKKQIDIRSSIQWRLIFAGGLITPNSIEKEITKAINERYPCKTE